MTTLLHVAALWLGTFLFSFALFAAIGGEEVMGLMQREKGKRFERAIAAELRKRWPDAVVRRSSQAERAYQSDVFIEGGPPMLSRLWLELQDARSPTPAAKLEQAEYDAQCAWIRGMVTTTSSVVGTSARISASGRATPRCD